MARFIGRVVSARRQISRTVRQRFQWNISWVLALPPRKRSTNSINLIWMNQFNKVIFTRCHAYACVFVCNGDVGRNAFSNNKFTMILHFAWNIHKHTTISLYGLFRWKRNAQLTTLRKLSIDGWCMNMLDADGVVLNGWKQIQCARTKCVRISIRYETLI